MKKGIIFLFILFIGFSVNAQNFGGGVFAGLSASQLDGDLSAGYKKAGLSFGAFTNISLTKYVDAQLELKYIQKGSNSKNDDPTLSYVSKLNYLELPIFLKYRFLNKFSANIGVTVGYLQKASETFGGLENPSDPGFDKFEFSGLAGIEYEISKNLFFNARFNYSILPIRPHPGDKTFFANQGQYNNVLTFAVYYQIGNSNPNPYAKRGIEDCDCNKRRKRFSLR